MAMVMIDLLGASASITGSLQRRMLEVRPNVFVGNLSARSADQLWAAVVNDNPRAALMVYPARNELGLGMKTLGAAHYKVIDHFGIPLVEKIGSKRDAQ